MATSYGIGLMNAWLILWTARLLVFEDLRGTARRVERREWVKNKIEGRGFENRSAVGQGMEAGSSKRYPNANGEVRRRKTSVQANGDAHIASIEESKTAEGLYCWQPLPANFFYRFLWAMDLIFNLRGPGWSFAISQLPPPPVHVQQSLDPNSKPKPQTSPTGNNLSPNIRFLILSALRSLVFGYLSLDILKHVMMLDPYFTTGNPNASPPTYLPVFVVSSTLLMKMYRMCLSLLAVYTPLMTIFSLNPLFNIGLLGSSILGLRTDLWYYPKIFGSPTMVYRKGLAGFWGGWWHQMFRSAFDAAGNWVGDDLLGWSKKERKGQFLRTVVAFSCSGFLHACGSYTLPGKTHPMRGPFSFFALQIIGVSGQRAAAIWFGKVIGTRDKVPRWARGVGNVLFVVTWLFCTAPLFGDDVASGGIWLMEPVPYSIIEAFRGGQGWRAARTLDEVLYWWQGSTWWRSGLAFY